jgi:hypothetical protein
MKDDQEYAKGVARLQILIGRIQRATTCNTWSGHLHGDSIMVADTYSTKIGIILQGTGNNNNPGGTTSTPASGGGRRDCGESCSSVVTGGTLDLSGTPPPAAPRKRDTPCLSLVVSWSATDCDCAEPG